MGIGVLFIERPLRPSGQVLGDSASLESLLEEAKAQIEPGTRAAQSIGVLFGWFGRKIDGDSWLT